MFPPPRLIAQGSDLSEAEKLRKDSSALSHNMASTGMEPPPYLEEGCPQPVSSHCQNYHLAAIGSLKTSLILALWIVRKPNGY